MAEQAPPDSSRYGKTNDALCPNCKTRIAPRIDIKGAGRQYLCHACGHCWDRWRDKDDRDKA